MTKAISITSAQVADRFLICRLDAPTTCLILPKKPPEPKAPGFFLCIKKFCFLAFVGARPRRDVSAWIFDNFLVDAPAGCNKINQQI